jgi:oxygen-independent coproporphyrinogen III oxidase
MDKIKIGVSSCLLGANVRYDGKHKLDHYLKDNLDRFVEWVPVCPEVECGLSVPREAMHLIGDMENPRLVTKNSNIDHTDKIMNWAEKKLEQFEKENLAGFIFKSDSPSCGLNSVFSKKGTGIFAKAFMGRFQSMPVEDEIALHDSAAIKSFLDRVSSFKKQCGLYVHIPFCRKKCLYCDFYSDSHNEDLANSYISVVLNQIQSLGMDFSSIYIGGGTPSVLSLDLLDSLLSCAAKFKRKDSEFTIEVNPESVDNEKLKLFIDKGVNRISIGVQSFDDLKLRSLGRIHDAKDALKAIELSKKSGFNNISIDMIFGVSGESLKDWQVELQKAASLGIQHMSCYSLSYEKDTPLFRMREKESIVPLDEEVAAELYRYAMSYLPDMGYRQYEVSSFSKPGFECSHNLNYWDNNPYIGIGPSAVSYINDVRFENVNDTEEYIDRYEKGIELAVNKEKLSGIKKAKETAAVKIRTGAGIDYNWFKDKTGFDLEDIAEKGMFEELAKDGLLEYKKDDATKEIIGIRLTEKGFLFSDTVSSAFL